MQRYKFDLETFPCLLALPPRIDWCISSFFQVSSMEFLMRILVLSRKIRAWVSPREHFYLHLTSFLLWLLWIVITQILWEKFASDRYLQFYLRFSHWGFLFIAKPSELWAPEGEFSENCRRSEATRITILWRFCNWLNLKVP